MTKEQQLLKDIENIKSKDKLLSKKNQRLLDMKKETLRVLRDNRRFHRARYDALEKRRLEAFDVWNGRKPATKESDSYSYDVEEVDWELCIRWRPKSRLPNLFEMDLDDINLFDF